jgi:penicillin-binding protein A
MLTFLRFAAFAAAMILLAFGFSDTDEQADVYWLACLAGAGVLLAIAWWPRDTRTLPIFNRTILRWSTIIVVCFALVTVQLVRVQIVESSRTIGRVGEAPNGEVIVNPRERLKSLDMRRGRILDRDGQVLADTVQREDGTYQRAYPELSTAPLIGYYSPQIYGSSNIELEFDEYLSGDEGGNPAEEWLNGILHETRHGYDLGLSVDLELQQQAVDLLAGRPGAVVLMDAETGAVLAMAGEPLFDPNRLYANEGQLSEEESLAVQDYWAQLNADENAPLFFRPTQGIYSPGSTFKTVTSTAYLDTGKGDLNTVFRDEGLLDVDGRVIEEANRPDPNKIDYTFEESYAYSLNVVFAQVGLQIGSQTLWDYGTKFGFGEAIPFDFFTTDLTQIASSREALNNRALLADSGFGQGEILASPLQMAMVMAAVENDGEMPKPYVVETVLDDDGDVLERFGDDTWRRVMHAETSSSVRKLLMASADYGGAQGIAIDGAVTGGKTGTAEAGVGDPHAWFIGFAEANERKLVVSVVVEHGGRGAEAALPIGRAMLESGIKVAAAE